MNGLGQWAALAQVGVALAQTGTSVYIARQDKKEAAKNADRQEQMARDEATRSANLQRELAARQERVELAKMGRDATGKPLPGAAGLASKVPGGWVTIGVGGAVVLGLTLFLILRRR